MPVLLLVGAGHAHLHVVRSAFQLVSAGYEVQLLAPRFFHYSGVASATAAGVLSGDVGRIDVRALADASGIEFHEGTLESLDLQTRTATSSDGVTLTYDVLSINIGSVVAPVGMHVDPAVLRVKPLSGLAEVGSRLEGSAGGSGASVVVVGGGRSGLELATHLSVRPDVARVRLVDSGPLVGADLPGGARRRLLRLLAERGVSVHTGSVVRELGERALVGDTFEVSYDLALLATGLTAPRLISETGLGDDRGVPVRATLQHVDHDDVYAVGDCALFLPRPLPRVGVHGVRQGPVLLRSLLARLGGNALPTYRPRRRSLAILDLGDGIGLAVWGRWWWYGVGPLRLKRHIDRRWLEGYQVHGSTPPS